MELIPNPTEVGDTQQKGNLVIASSVPQGDSRHKRLGKGALDLRKLNSNPKDRNRTWTRTQRTGLQPKEDRTGTENLMKLQGTPQELQLSPLPLADKEPYFLARRTTCKDRALLSSAVYHLQGLSTF